MNRRDVACALLAPALSLAAPAGCSPDLAEGAYSCAGGECPSGWFCHDRDRRCYSTPESSRDEETLGTAGAGQSEGTLDDYAPCGARGGEACREGRCELGPMAETGQCSRSCDTDNDCPESPTGSAVCSLGQCLQGCGDPTDCDDPFACYSLAEAMPFDASTRACIEVGDPDLDGTKSCERSDGSCPMPAWCATHPEHGAEGVCSMRCGADTACPGVGVCTEIIRDMVRHCLSPCDDDEDCGTGLICRQFGSPVQVCVPTNWKDLDAPLEPPSRMPPRGM